MEIQSYLRGRTVKTVVVTDAHNMSDEFVLDFAMRHAGETKSSLFGWKVRWQTPQTASVDLYTD